MLNGWLVFVEMVFTLSKPRIIIYAFRAPSELSTHTEYVKCELNEKLSSTAKSHVTRAF